MPQIGKAMNKKANNDPVPLEAAVKYLVRDRDRYKERLDALIPYAKSLEHRLYQKESPEGLDDAWAEIKALRQEIANLKNQVEQFREAKNAYRDECRELRKENRQLKGVVRTPEEF